MLEILKQPAGDFNVGLADTLALLDQVSHREAEQLTGCVPIGNADVVEAVELTDGDKAAIVQGQNGVPLLRLTEGVNAVSYYWLGFELDTEYTMPLSDLVDILGFTEKRS